MEISDSIISQCGNSWTMDGQLCPWWPCGGECERGRTIHQLPFPPPCFLFGLCATSVSSGRWRPSRGGKLQEQEQEHSSKRRKWQLFYTAAFTTFARSPDDLNYGKGSWTLGRTDRLLNEWRCSVDWPTRILAPAILRGATNIFFTSISWARRLHRATWLIPNRTTRN